MRLTEREQERLLITLAADVAERRRGRKAGPELDGAAVRGIAAVHARLCLGLRSFFHPAAGRTHAWDIRRVADLAVHLDTLPTDDGRRTVSEVLATVAPTLARVTASSRRRPDAHAAYGASASYG